MGRKRRKDLHLPQGMTLERGTYYCRKFGQQRVRLGRDFVDAMTEYAKLRSAQWSGRTVGDAIDRYIIDVLPLKRSEQTRKDELRALRRLKSVFGTGLPDQVLPQHLYRYIDARRKPDGTAAPLAARREIGLFGHVYRKMIRWGMTAQNPAKGIELPPVPTRTRYVTDDELAAVRAIASDRVRVAIDLAVLTGLRQGDILSMTRSQLTDEGIEVVASKTGKSAVVTWTPDLLEAVARGKALSPQLPGQFLVRTNQGKRYTGSGFASLWQALMRRHVARGGEAFQFKDLRAKSASDSGSLTEASERLQHSTTAITSARYMRRATRIKPLR
jgi:integrase